MRPVSRRLCGVYQSQTFDCYFSLLLTRGSGRKGRGLGQDLVLVGHEGRKAKSLDVVGWGSEFGREISKSARFISPQPVEVQLGSFWQAPVTSGAKRGFKFDQKAMG